jgi:serine/threonine protein phosphatase PrpC
MTATDILWSAFEPTNAIGDAGRQPEIRSASSDLNVGVADTALDFLTIGPIELRACSSRGWSHRYKGTPRQDAYSILVDNDVLVIAVADGVSEGDYSQVAADTAARATVKLAADHIAKTGSVDWLQLSRRVALRIVEEAEYRQIVPDPGPDADINERLKAVRLKMSTTLIAAVIRRTATSAGYEAEIGVVAGDSAAYQLTVGSDVLTPLGGGKATGGPISSTSVKPLPGPATPEAITVFLAPGEMLVLGTDGIGDPVGDGTNDFGRELAARWQQPPTINDFLLDINVYRRSFDDDRTAVAIWLRPDLELPDEPEVTAEPAEQLAGLPGSDVSESPTDPVSNEFTESPAPTVEEADTNSTPSAFSDDLEAPGDGATHNQAKDDCDESGSQTTVFSKES